MKRTNSTSASRKKKPAQEPGRFDFSLLREKNAAYWETRRKSRSLEVFHRAATEVPAYTDFLKRHHVRPNDIKTYNDLLSVPVTSKKDYVKKYPIHKLMTNGTLCHELTYTSTSGSTGEPTYFARSEKVDEQGSVIHEMFFRNSARQEGSTLVIVCFGMGIWIGGLITYEGIKMLSRRGLPISIITPGINKTEIFRALKKLSPEYDQTVLYGYPPFIKDIIDEAPEHGINLKKLHIRISTAAEAFTEGFRKYLGGQIGMKDTSRDTMNIYGTADIGAVAFETPLSIDIRKLAAKHKKFFDHIFRSAPKTPTLAQFIPEFINFEEQDGELLLTGENTMPLVRYAIGDHGGVIGYKEMMSLCKEHDIVLPPPQVGVPWLELPFVYVFERNDFSTTLYGAQIYPEAIREVLIKPPFNKVLTGKFTLVTKYDKNHDQYLEVNLETRKEKKITPVIKSHLLNTIIKTMMLRHSEYKELQRFIGKRAHPKLVFWPAEDPLYFKQGIKQSWVKK